MKLIKAFHFLKNEGSAAFWRRLKTRFSRPSPIEFCLDFPAANAFCEGYLEVIGWASARQGTIETIQVLLDGELIGTAEHGLERPDVEAAFPSLVSLECGYGNLFPIISDTFDGNTPVQLLVRATDSLGNKAEITRNIFIRQDRNAIVQHSALTLPDLTTQAVLETIETSVVSVVIPALNGGDEIAVLLSSLKSQEGCEKVEMIVVDSGSQDNTVSTAKAYGAKVIQIPQESFSHSGARNLGADAASGDYLLFMTQDALPGSSRWLYELVSALKNSEAVAVTCAESPREDVDLFFRFVSWSHNRYLELAGQDKLLSWPEKEDHLSIRKSCQLNNVASLYVKDVFDKYRFQRDYAEDLDIGIRLARDGHKLAMLSSARVIHSHNRTAYYHLRRGFVDTVSLSKIFADFPLHQVDALDDLTRDAIALYQALIRLVEILPTRLTGVIKIPDFVGLINELLDLVCSQATPDTPVLCDFVDGKYVDFLARIKPSEEYTSGLLLSESSFAKTFRAMLTLVNEYLKESHEYSDAKLVDEYKEAMFKSHAAILGTFIAGYYVRCGEPANDNWLFDELRQGV